MKTDFTEHDEMIDEHIGSSSWKVLFHWQTESNSGEIEDCYAVRSGSELLFLRVNDSRNSLWRDADYVWE